MGSEAESSSFPLTTFSYSKPELGTLAKQLVERFTASQDAKLALAMAQSPAVEVKNVIEDLLALTVTTAVGEGESQVKLVTKWFLDGEVKTTVSPSASAVTGPVADLHTAQAGRPRVFPYAH
jgi:hypothetical protein